MRKKGRFPVDKSYGKIKERKRTRHQVKTTELKKQGTTKSTDGQQKTGYRTQRKREHNKNGTTKNGNTAKTRFTTKNGA